MQATEQALDDAKAVIQSQTIEIEELREAKESLKVAEMTIRNQEQALIASRQETEEMEAYLKRQHKNAIENLKKSHEAERSEFVDHLSGAETAVKDLRSELEKRMKTQSDLIRKLATQEELTQSLLGQQSAAERMHEHVKLELESASRRVVSLQDEVKRLAGRNASLEEAAQNLRVEANTWKRVDKLKMEKEAADMEQQVSSSCLVCISACK